MFKIFDTWKKVKDIFVKPVTKVYFGKWSRDPSLPVWRHGPKIYFTKTDYHIVTNRVCIKTNTGYEVSEHKLPGKLRAGDIVFNSNIRRKLRKWYLSWFPPCITLPIWLSFHIFNHDVMWKWKWDEIRFEYPPQFTIVAFGISLTISLHCPKRDKYAYDDNYWEAILNHIHLNKSGNLEETVKLSNIWFCWDKDGNKTSYFSVRPEFITQKHIEEYYMAISEIKAERGEKIL